DLIVCCMFYFFLVYVFFIIFFFFFQAEDGIRDKLVTGVQTCALPIYRIEKLKRRLSVTLTDGSRMVGEIFLRPVSRYRSRPEERSEERRVGKECRCRWWADH